MEIRKLLADDDAVSPVIGVILMVAITVILAAVIGAFVLGFGGGGPSAPSVTWETSDVAHNDTNGGHEVVFEHGGGDTIDDPSTLRVSHESFGEGSTSASEIASGAQFSAFNNTGGTPSGEAELIWTPSDGDSSQELATHDI